MMFDSATVSVATVYGFKDAKSLKEVFEHWTRDRDCVWHKGPYSYLTRQALEREGSLKEIHFRYNKLSEIVILTLQEDGWFCNTGGNLAVKVCDLLCDGCGKLIDEHWKKQHDAAHHEIAQRPLGVRLTLGGADGYLPLIEDFDG